MGTKRLVVKLNNILNENTGNDPGNALEIYGRVDIRHKGFNPATGEVETFVLYNLFDRSSNNAQEIVEGTAFIIESSTPEFDIFPGQFLSISINIGEQDDIGPDDNLVSTPRIIPPIVFNDLMNKPLKYSFEESNQRVSVEMSLKVMEMAIIP